MRSAAAAGLILSSLFGIPLGLLLLTNANDHLVKSILGATIVAFAIHSLVDRTRAHLRHDHWGWLVGCGFLSGVLGGAYGMNGPPLAVYGALRRWSPPHFRATLQGYFLPVSSVTLFGYLALGVWGPAVTLYFLVTLPAAALAIALGRVLNQKLRGRDFFALVYIGLIVIGGLLVVQVLAY